jgi:hypothetical protein
MRSKVIFMVVLLMGFGFVFTAAQAEEQESALLFIEEQVVKPAKIAELEASLQEMVAYCNEHNFPYAWETYSDDNYRYYYVMPIKDLSDINNMMKATAELGKKVGEPWQAMMNKYQETYEHVKLGLIRTRPDLSYVPENPRLTPEEAAYIRWGMCYVKADKTVEFEEIMKEWVALFKEKNISGGFNTFMGEMGTDNPFYFYAEPAKSPADFFTWNEKAMEILGDESMTLWMKTLGLLRNYENKGGMLRPELSYLPKKK